MWCFNQKNVISCQFISELISNTQSVVISHGNPESFRALRSEFNSRMARVSSRNGSAIADLLWIEGFFLFTFESTSQICSEHNTVR